MRASWKLCPLVKLKRSTLVMGRMTSLSWSNGKIRRSPRARRKGMGKRRRPRSECTSFDDRLCSHLGQCLAVKDDEEVVPLASLGHVGSDGVLRCKGVHNLIQLKLQEPGLCGHVFLARSVSSPIGCVACVSGSCYVLRIIQQGKLSVEPTSIQRPPAASTDWQQSDSVASPVSCSFPKWPFMLWDA